MIDAYEMEVLKNYFQIEGSFAGMYKKESRLYNNIAQLKYREVEEVAGIPIDTKAPGGMYPVLYALMGAQNYKNDKVDIVYYAYHLLTMKVNGVKLTKGEESQLDEFTEYYNFETIEDFINAVEPEKMEEYTMKDILVTHCINVAMGMKRRTILTDKISEAGITDLPTLLEYKEEFIKLIKHLVPPVTVTEEQDFSVSESGIRIPKDVNILWEDLLLMNASGTEYRALYRPIHQIDMYMPSRLQGHILFIDTMVMLRDDRYRRKFGLSNLMGYWGVEEPYLEVTGTRDYVIFPYLDQGAYVPKAEQIYCIWKPPHSIYVDRVVLDYIIPMIHELTFTDKYISEFAAQTPGVYLASVPHNGVYVPVGERIFGRPPKDNNYTNLTRYNLIEGV